MDPKSSPNGSNPPEKTDDTKSKKHPKPKIHSRTASYNKINALSRPSLNRSKSTDGVIRVKRNNKSFTKLTNLQPLTKTLSNQLLKSNLSNTSLKNLGLAHGGLKLSAKQGKAILRLNDDNDDYEDVDDQEEERVEQPVQENSSIPLQRVFQQALDPFSELGDVQNDANPIDTEPQTQPPQESQTQTPAKPQSQSTSSQLTQAQINLVRTQSQSPQTKSSQEHPTTKSQLLHAKYPPEPTLQPQSVKKESLPSSITPLSNLYGGSLFLSQSTGLVRKIDPTGMDQYEESTDSGVSFKTGSVDLNQSVAEPVVVNRHVLPENSYQPDQSIFNNLQRTNSQYVSTKKQLQQQKEEQNLGNNFSSFLSNKSSLNDNHDNRTQQRLWLQRENSLMDVSLDQKHIGNFSNLSLNNLMFSHNYQSSTNLTQMSNPQTPNLQTPGVPVQMTPTESIPESVSTTNMHGLLMMYQNGAQNPIQSRVEYERLNREYLNVRRHLNPVGEALIRVKNNSIRIDKRGDSELNRNGNTFEEFAPHYSEKEQEVVQSVNKIWQEALVQTTSVKYPSPVQRPPVQRLPSRTQYMNMRQAPATRKLQSKS